MWINLSDRFPKAQKEYHCYLCGETINKNEKYFYKVGLSEGDFCTIRMHLECEVITKGWSEEDWGISDYRKFKRPNNLKTHIQGILNSK